MNIVLLANYSKTSISGYVYQSLVKLGHQVTFISPQPDEPYMIGCSPVVDVPKLLLSLGLAPDLLLMVESSVHPLLVPINLQKVKCKTAWWAIDNHINYRWHKEFAAFFDHVYFAQKDFVEPASNYLGKKVNWLPLACDSTIHKKNTPFENRDLFIGFVGNMNKYRQKYFDDLKSNVELDTIAGLNPQQMTDYYNHCKAVFNISMRGDMNMRTFEAMACGSLLITQDINNGLRDLFEPNKHIVLHQLNNASDVINYYHHNLELASQIATAGYELVINNHTYEHRMNFITQHINDESVKFTEEVYAIRNHFFVTHRHFKSAENKSLDQSYMHISIFKKLRANLYFLKAYIWQKIYLASVKKFG